MVRRLQDALGPSHRIPSGPDRTAKSLIEFFFEEISDAAVLQLWSRVSLPIASLNLMVDFSDFQSRRSWLWFMMFLCVFYIFLRGLTHIFLRGLTSEEDPISTPFPDRASTTISTTSLVAWTSNVRRGPSESEKTSEDREFFGKTEVFIIMDDYNIY